MVMVCCPGGNCCGRYIVRVIVTSSSEGEQQALVGFLAAAYLTSSDSSAEAIPS